MRVAPKDCERFLSLDIRLSELARHLEPLFMQAPPDLQRGGFAGLLELLRFGWKFRGLKGRQVADLIAFATGSLGEFLDRSLESPHLKSLVLSNSLYGKHGGPYDPGTLFGLLFHLLGGGSEAKQGFVGHVMGGMGAITQAMAAACVEKGVEIRTAHSRAASVDPIGSCGRRGAGGRLADRRRHRGIQRGSQAHVPRAGGGRGARRTVPRRRARHQDGWALRQAQPGAGRRTAVVGGDPDADTLRNAQFTLVPWLEGAQRCYESARQGRIHERLWIDCLVPSLLDSSLVTPGRHVMTCFVQYLPGKPTEGWETAREPLRRQLLAHLAEHVPAVQRSLVASRLYTPADLESTFGITEGNIFHGDLRPDQLFFMRPLPAYARYATPVRALYLCGAGTHPGGGVTGAPGFNAAHRILSDLSRKRELRRAVDA